MNDIVGFLHDTRFEDLPDEVRHQTRRCLLDLLAVAVAGTTTHLSRIMRDHVHRHMPASADGPRLLFDGRRTSPPGAALANAATIDAMDGHDGHRLTKGHAGAAILPACLAVMDNQTDRTVDHLIAAMVVGYELAIRAGIALHSHAHDYHSSGAWNAVGASAVGARVLGLSRSCTKHALGIAEFSAPRAPMLRVIAHPTMVKDSSAWGAHAGVSAALLAADGFTGAPAELLDGPKETWADLGSRWRILEQYAKLYSVCRWAHPAVEAVLALRQMHSFTPESILSVEVRTFEAATKLATRNPYSTEEAQYSLPFSVAVACVHGELPIELIAHPDRVDKHVRRIAQGMQITESSEMTAGFPENRSAAVSISLANGSRVSAHRAVTRGDPEFPLTDEDLQNKFWSYAMPILGEARAEQLVRMLTRTTDTPLRDLLDEVTAPLPVTISSVAE